MSVARGLWPAPPVPSVSIPLHVLRPPNRVHMRAPACGPTHAHKKNFTTPLAVYTANAINAVLKMCIPPYLAQFSCHDPHPTPSGTARAANSPDLRARRPISPKICLPSSASQAHFSLVLSQSPARGAHRSQATPIEIHTFGSPTRSRVRLLHHKGEKQHSQRLCPNWPTKSY